MIAWVRCCALCTIGPMDTGTQSHAKYTFHFLPLFVSSVPYRKTIPFEVFCIWCVVNVFHQSSHDIRRDHNEDSMQEEWMKNDLSYVNTI